MKQVVLILLTCFSFCANAQKENNIWYFGDHAGLDFSSGAPVAINNSAMYSFENSAVVCDSLGNLLFYTNGENVWDSTHTVMPNGSSLMGNNHNAQIGVVKKPGTQNIYYIFHPDHIAGPNGLRYSEVDMSLNGGLGDVTANKNLLIANTMEDKIDVVRHYNNTDFWVVTHKAYSNSFYSYLVTASGINLTPVVSSVSRYTSTWGHFSASIKISPDRSRLVFTSQGNDSTVQVFDFDCNTGRVSNPLTFPQIFNWTAAAYSAEFSPNGKILYAACSMVVFQYDLLAGTDTAIFNSWTRFLDPPAAPPNASGGIEIGPDNKLYRCFNGINTLSLFHNPNILGRGCNWDSLGISLGANTTELGLPPNNDFYPVMQFTNLCQGDSVAFSTTALHADSAQWFFDDTLSGNNSSTSFNPKHLYANDGNYVITLIIYDGGITDTITKTLHISPYPEVNLGNDTTLCDGELLTLTAGPHNSNFLWYDNNTTITNVVDSSGTYWVESTLNACSSYDTINVNYISLPVVNFGNDTLLCNNAEIILDASNPNASYLWQDSSTDSILSVTLQGTYWATVTANGCSNSDTILVEYTTVPVIDLGNDTSLCQNDSLWLNASFPYSTYIWKDNSTDSTFLVNNSGTYWVNATNLCGMGSDTIKVIYTLPPNVILAPFNPDTLCDDGNPVTLPAGNPPGGSYSGAGIVGNTFDPTQVAISSYDIIYTYTDSNSCTNSDTTLITVTSCVGIVQNETDYGILIYPNPNTGQFIIEKPKGLNDKIIIKIYDVQTKLILEQELLPNQQKVQIDIQNISKGIYYLHIVLNDKIVIKQIIKE